MKALASVKNANEYPIRRWIADDGMPFDHWDRDRGYSHATGYEVALSPELGDTWLEYVDPKTGETFLAR